MVPRKNLSDNYSDVLLGIVEVRNNGILCSNTEELLESFEDNNRKTKDIPKEKQEKRIVGSMDAVSLFTRLEANKLAEIVREEVIKSKEKFNNVDHLELGIYIRKTLSESEVKEKGYERILPKYLKVGKEYRNERNEPSDFHEYAEDIIRLFNDDFEIDDDEEATEDNPKIGYSGNYG